MQSSCKIIKSSSIEDTAVITPPIFERIYSKLNMSNTNEISKNQIDLDGIFKSIETQAKQEAADLIHDAKRQAEEIIENAKACAEQVKKNYMDEGYQKGYAEGYKSGYEFGISEAENDAFEIRKKAEDSLISCQLESRNYIRNCKEEIIDLSLTIARQVITTELTINQDAIFRIAENVITSSVDKKQIILKVSPCDFAIIKNRKDELSIFVEDSNNIIISADPSLTQGSIKADSPSGFIDGSLDSKLNEIRKILTEV